MPILGIVTRTKRRDYSIFPSYTSQWWHNGYRQYTSFERPTLIVEGLGRKRSLRFFIGAIPSTRKDFAGTTIRYSIFGTIEQDDDDYEQFAKLIQRYADDPSLRYIGEQLDLAIGDDIEREYAIDIQPNNAFITAILQNIQNAWKSWLESEPGRSSDSEESKLSFNAERIVGIENENIVSEMHACIFGIYHHGNGKLLYLNLLDNSTCYSIVYDRYLNIAKEHLKKLNSWNGLISHRSRRPENMSFNETLRDDIFHKISMLRSSQWRELYILPDETLSIDVVIDARTFVDELKPSDFVKLFDRKALKSLVMKKWKNK